MENPSLSLSSARFHQLSGPGQFGKAVGEFAAELG